VFLTVLEDPDFINAAAYAGASGYVFKRNLLTDLAAALRHALRE
jgi:DNA-binding NarL/FixJ family response regulator